MVVGHCTYKMKKGQRAAFLSGLADIGYIANVNKEEGVVYYTPYLPLDDEDVVFVAECWESGDCLVKHMSSSNLKDLDILTELYVEGLTLDFYDGDITRTCEYKTAAELTAGQR
ncbi:MAG: antibiotic biosynthesis monooxygenase [Oscillospiraceae bacterium]|nr:antibiotic biosynthesis monooxygenase [Oscillospiraceae bacterium]